MLDILQNKNTLNVRCWKMARYIPYTFPIEGAGAPEPEYKRQTEERDENNCTHADDLS